MTNRIFDLIQLQNGNRGLLWTEEDKEEFAALVVLACANIEHYWLSKEDKKSVAIATKLHFGVEE